ncbi:MAG: (4Fe-4S)-binding protein [Bacteroidales bacterium]|nr:(4Fe-4S)-binding protein [Bacteroidales bacterium]MDD4210055.1 (4Fe-4S)-binding protein [Bacteroidales bacterium]
MNIVKKYTNGEITIVWEPAKCTYAAACVKFCPEVFKPRERPWVKPDNATTEKIIDTVNKCPSGALWYYYNEEIQQTP